MNAEGIEVAGRGHVEIDARAVDGLVADGLEAVTTMAAAERNRIGYGGGGDAGENGDAPLEFREELRGVFGRVVVQARIDGHSEHAAGAEADVYVFGGAQAAEAESGDAEKNEGHGNLRYDQEIAKAPEAAG